MNIVKLNETHIAMSRPLFTNNKYMGSMINSSYFLDKDFSHVDYYHEAFYNTYLTGLKNYHAYGAIDNNGDMQGIITFYESTDDASWYGTGIRNKGNRTVARALLDAAIMHNEAEGRLKFYTLWSAKHSPLLRRFAFSKWADERYDYFDEFTVEAKHQCKFNLAWQILYNRTLVPVDSVVRCTFLKQQYRTTIFNAGGL